jgi:hypothetical protein
MTRNSLRGLKEKWEETSLERTHILINLFSACRAHFRWGSKKLRLPAKEQQVDLTQWPLEHQTHYWYLSSIKSAMKKEAWICIARVKEKLG